MNEETIFFLIVDWAGLVIVQYEILALVKLIIKIVRSEKK